MVRQADIPRRYVADQHWSCSAEIRRFPRRTVQYIPHTANLASPRQDNAVSISVIQPGVPPQSLNSSNTASANRNRAIQSSVRERQWVCRAACYAYYAVGQSHGKTMTSRFMLCHLLFHLYQLVRAVKSFLQLHGVSYGPCACMLCLLYGDCGA